ncbi:MAG: alpha/beta hydrolase [Halieaceae bacterium]|jgi:acetyl esterase/lipase|nr:alpha/beta hydrolase [Halieaceae bacterium]
MIWLMVVVVAILLAINFFVLRGEDLKIYDTPRPEPLNEGREPSQAHFEAIASLGDMNTAIQSVSRRQQLAVMREHMDALGEEVEFDGQIIAVDIDGIRGEWILAPGADPDRRLLYIHGGAFVAGSPLSHRAITTEYARRYGGAVFALDYRLMPEHPRQAGIDDCRAAYRWILETSPDGPGRASELFVSGDSAGGNLSLSLSNWVRDQGITAPNGVIALSPATDNTFASPSLKFNVESDHMLGPLFGKMNRVPKLLLRLVNLFNNRMPPRHPNVSPVYADLANLPPTLVHVSAQEMLLDDAVRYVNKARSQGSPVELQAWGHMLHVWHIFVLRDMEESAHAFDQIERFMNAHRSVAGAEAAA